MAKNKEQSISKFIDLIKTEELDRESRDDRNNSHLLKHFFTMNAVALL